MGKRIVSHYRNDREWSDTFSPKIKRILGAHLIDTSPIEEDIKRNTDMVITAAGTRIALRMRRYDFLERYPDDFTIRLERSSGMKTEFAKIMENWGDYNFYGFENKAGDDVASYSIGRLDVFRRWIREQIEKHNGAYHLNRRVNNDGTTSFAIFDLDDMPDDYLIARKRHDPFVIKPVSIPMRTLDQNCETCCFLTTRLFDLFCTKWGDRVPKENIKKGCDEWQSKNVRR